MLNPNDEAYVLYNWYTITPCAYEDGKWRLIRHHAETSANWDEYDTNRTHIAESYHKDALISIVDGKLDIFFPETKEEPIFAK